MTERLAAIIRAQGDNMRTNPAVAADVQYRPAEWTPDMEAELIAKRYGTDAERIDRLIAEQNERTRRT